MRRVGAEESAAGGIEVVSGPSKVGRQAGRQAGMEVGGDCAFVCERGKVGGRERKECRGGGGGVTILSARIVKET